MAFSALVFCEIYVIEILSRQPVVHFVPPMVRRLVRAVWVTCFCALAQIPPPFLDSIKLCNITEIKRKR